MNDTDTLRAAQAGDEAAFERLVGGYRRELYAHCYRLLGSVADAEDALQEALLRAWRALPRFEGRSSLRSWLYRIATNACLRAIERRPPRVLPIDYGPAADPHDEPAAPLLESVWIGPTRTTSYRSTRASSSARPSSSRSSPRSSTCLRGSARC
jgi:RNA polymerase sigma-70 factor (ECF subfamily)